MKNYWVLRKSTTRAAAPINAGAASHRKCGAEPGNTRLQATAPSHTSGIAPGVQLLNFARGAKGLRTFEVNVVRDDVNVNAPAS
jgi:hypothetical protein